MMKSSIQAKLLLLCIFLVLLTTMSLSSIYYTLTKQDKQRESRQRIQIAFEIIRDDFVDRQTHYPAKFKEFSGQATSLQWILSVYNQLDTKVDFFSDLSNAANLSKIGSELQKFGHLITADQLELYAMDTRLIMAYQRKNDGEEIGVYAPSQDGAMSFVDTDSYVELTTNQRSFPDTPLPEGLQAVYTQAFPSEIETIQFSEKQRVGLQVITPIVRRGAPVGLLVGKIYYTQEMLERYAALSQTEVNLFSGQRWSVGTLPDQSSLDAETFSDLISCDALLRQEASIEVVSASLGDHHYYQGHCAFLNAQQNPLGAISVSLSQAIEAREIRKLLRSVLGVSAAVSLLAIAISLFVSRKSVKFLQQLILYIERIATGDLPKKIAGDYKGEFQEIQQNVNLLIESMHEITLLAEDIANGTIAVNIKKRSEEDTLMQALQTMVTSLSDVTRLAGEIAEGNLTLEVRKRSETDELMGALQSMVGSLRDVTRLAGEIAAGNLSVDITARSEKDELMQALAMMVDSLRDVTRLAENIADGDLTVEVTTRSEKDRLMQALNAMMVRLNNIVLDVKATADRVASGSHDMSLTAEHLSQGSSQQAAAAEEASSSMEQMTANIRQNSENAKVAETMAAESAQDAKQGGDAVVKTVKAMKKIEERISIIQEISMQTNILSMNATIEAAKAQDYGKGFAVVASEVRALAQRSREAAEEIEQLVKSCVEISEQAGTILQRLVPNSKKTAELVQEINAASTEQYMGVEQINNAIQQLDQIIQQNASTADDMASSAEEFSLQVEQLRETIQFFRVKEQLTEESDEEPGELVQALQTLLSNEGADEHVLMAMLKVMQKSQKLSSKAEKTDASQKKEHTEQQSISQEATEETDGLIEDYSHRDAHDDDFERF